MISMADMIMSFLLFPVTLFVIIPLIMLCGWLLFRLSLPLCTRKKTEDQEDHLEEVITLTEMG